jgi:hypothetical protein
VLTAAWIERSPRSGEVLLGGKRPRHGGRTTPLKVSRVLLGGSIANHWRYLIGAERRIVRSYRAAVIAADGPAEEGYAP